MVTASHKKTAIRIQKSPPDRRVVYFSGKLLSSKDLRKEQEYFRDRKKSEGTTKGKPLHIIELSGIASKYIGETEKNLKMVFEKIKDMNGILLFDEADALFGKRSRAKDSHDRYANIETNCLLERIQNYNGIILVTPNHKRPITKQHVTKLDYVICLPIRKQR